VDKTHHGRVEYSAGREDFIPHQVFNSLRNRMIQSRKIAIAVEQVSIKADTKMWSLVKFDQQFAPHQVLMEVATVAFFRTQGLRMQK
jgi:hypothetical protein